MLENLDYLNMPKISIIIPIYNVEKYIKQCLESIISQSLKDIEILCIDDCGTDSSIKIVESFAKKDSRIKIIQLDKNKGLGAARNVGIKNSNGKYIIFVDSDDYIDPNLLEIAYAKIEKLQLDSVWYNVKLFNDTKKSFTKDNYFLKTSAGILNITPNNINKFTVIACNKIYRTSVIKKNNIMFSENILFEDLEFYYKFFTKSKETYFINKHLYIYRLRPNSILSSKKNREDIFKAIKNVYYYLLKEEIFETYKESFIQLIVQSIERSDNVKQIIPYVINLLNQINFPRQYQKDKKGLYDFLNYIVYFNNLPNFRQVLNKYYFWLIFVISKFLPKKNYRKKYREKFKKYIF
ncbi:MAG: glycosyltransferase [Endomicrobium sp.]|jgi:glycosyltransferase involved in cell wall biosynthesis|nr:glycosyltransferase [Endomicrobium sp.]